MKKVEVTFTVKELKNLFDKVTKAEKRRGKLVGFIGGIPIYANAKVPEGELWIKSEFEFTKVTISDL